MGKIVRESREWEAMTSTFEREVKRGDRFGFGKNWKRFLSVLNEERITEAEKSLKQMLELEDLQGKSFLDIGSGSGLFSLAARRLGAKVHSFDYDPDSVGCTQELKRRFFPDNSDWTVEQGSVLDVNYIKSLGQFDIVYSWGVLHHTGAMWQALENASLPVAQGGDLFIAIYNDRGSESKRWLKIKKFYCASTVGKKLVSAWLIPFWILRAIAGDILKAKNPLVRYVESQKRGMSVFYDWFDWLGGYPFEVATPEEIFMFYRLRGFTLKNLITGGLKKAMNQFVFTKL